MFSKLSKKIRYLFIILLTITHISVQAGNGFCVDLKQINQEYFDESMGMVWHPTRDRWLVWEKKGHIHLLSPKNGISSRIAELTENIDLRGDGGLLSIAIHPQYPEKPFLFAVRTIISENSRILVLEKYILDIYNIILKSKQELLRIVITGTDNTAGFITFDNEDNLLLSIGDGRNIESDIPTDATNPETLPGSILRLDVDSHHNKVIAAQNNPFKELLDGAVETYAYGFKNPNRFSVDSLNGDIWLSDSGSQTAGEINYIKPKHFYGWDCLDGSRQTSADFGCSDSNTLYAPPVFEYTIEQGIQSIGGYVYRGNENERWYGRYFFADYGSGKIWSARPNGDRRLNNISLVYSNQIVPISFAHDNNNELFLIDYQGRIFSMNDRQCRAPQSILSK